VIASGDDARAWLGQTAGASSERLARLAHLVDLLGEENARQNLVSPSSLAGVWQRHIADSAQLLRFVPRETQQSTTWLDLGTGAGFPGIVLAVLRPDWQFTLVESRAKRIEWLNRVIRALGLANARVEGRRVELMPDAAFDAISARAFAPLDRLLEISARFSTSATQWVLPKGRSARDEVEKLAGWNHTFHVEPSLTDPEAGIVIGTLEGKNARKKARPS